MHRRNPGGASRGLPSTAIVTGNVQIANRVRSRRPLGALIAAVLTAAALGACGASSQPNATTVLRQTFSGQHQISSGVVELTVSIAPSGSSLLSSPIVLSFGGPFQSRGAGQLPASHFTASVSALGQNGSLGIISTGTRGYVTMSGQNYPLPAASFRRLESGFAGLGGSGSASGAGALSSLGIDPMRWLRDPTVVSTDESVGGTSTTHIAAGVDLPSLLTDLSTVLSKAPALGVKGIGTLPSSLSPAERSTIAADVRNPSVDIWTANSDRTLRRIEIGLTVLVHGRESTELGGLTSVRIEITLQYTDLGQAQSISEPTSLQPYRVLQAKLSALVSEVEGAIALGSPGSGASSSSSSSGATGGSGSPAASGGSGSSGSAGKVSRYSRCINAASGNAAKMQKCASLLNAG